MFFFKAWPFRPSSTAPRKNMTCRRRQTTKGTTAKNKRGATRTTPHCLWSIGEKGQKPTVPIRRKSCWGFGPAMSPCGNIRPRQFGPAVSPSRNTGPRVHDSVQTHSFSPRVTFALRQKIAKSCFNCARRGRGLLSRFCVTRDVILP